MAYKISGSVLKVGATQSITSKNGNSFTKRDLVITVRKFDPDTGIPTNIEGNTPKFQFIQDKCSLLDNLVIGDIVTIHFDVSGRTYDKDGMIDYFTDIRPFKIDKLQSQTIPPKQSDPFANAPILGTAPNQQGTDELPF